jgi:hypothetical protein
MTIMGRIIEGFSAGKRALQIHGESYLVGTKTWSDPPTKFIYLVQFLVVITCTPWIGSLWTALDQGFYRLQFLAV